LSRHILRLNHFLSLINREPKEFTFRTLVSGESLQSLIELVKKPGASTVRVEKLESGHSLHVVEDGADDSADDAAFHGLPASFVRHVSLQGMRQFRDGQGLQPDAAGSGERCQKKQVTIMLPMPGTVVIWNETLD